MKLNPPLIITSRLLPGLRVPAHGSLTEISIEIAGDTRDGRTRYRYYIDSPDFEYTSDDLKSGCQGGDLQEGLSSLLSFLGAAAESCAYRLRTGRTGENEDLFPANVVEWAHRNSDELAMLACELEENRNLITDGD